MTRLRVNKNNVQILDGKWEGLYAWVAANYMLGRLKKCEILLKNSQNFILGRIGGNLSLKNQTIGIIDQGGASLQVVVEIEHPENAPNGVLDKVN